MSLLFWRKTRDIAPENARSEAVTEEAPLPVRAYPNNDDEPAVVKLDKDTIQPPIAGQTITRLVQVPGIGTGAAYADGEAFGTLITWHNVFRSEKLSGTIVGAFLLDLDDEGIQIDIPLFVRSITATTDNNAFAPSDDDLMALRAVVSISSFYNWSSNQFGQASNLGVWINGESPNLYSQLVVRGAANIAAGAVPWVGLVVVPD